MIKNSKIFFITGLVMVIIVISGILAYAYRDSLFNRQNSNGTTPPNDNQSLSDDQKKTIGLPTNLEARVENRNINGTIIPVLDVNLDTTTVGPPDADSDGVSDEDEKNYGTDSSKADTDGDNLFDKDEIFSFKTDPNKLDTDGDGFDDGTEVMTGHDPLKKG